MKEEQPNCCSAEIKALFTEWIENRENTLKTKEIADKLIPLMEKCGCDICKQLLELRHSLVKKSQWIFGGDGWGYDIGFGGLDHELASGERKERKCDICRTFSLYLIQTNYSSYLCSRN